MSHLTEFEAQQLGRYVCRPHISEIFEKIGTYRHNDSLAKDIYSAYLTKDSDDERIVMLEQLVMHLFEHRAEEARQVEHSHLG